MTMREQADVIADGLRALSVSGALLVGHSYGGTVALTIARRHPELVGCLVLVAPMGGGRPMPLKMRNEARALLLVTVPGIGDLIRRTVGWGITKMVVRRAFTRAFFPSPVASSWMEHAYPHTMQPPRCARSTPIASTSTATSAGSIAIWMRCRVPVGIVRAIDDHMVGSWSAVGLRDDLPRVVSFQECNGGHMIPITRPETVAEAVRAVSDVMGGEAARWSRASRPDRRLGEPQCSQRARQIRRIAHHRIGIRERLGLVGTGRHAHHAGTATRAQVMSCGVSRSRSRARLARTARPCRSPARASAIGTRASRSS